MGNRKMKKMEPPPGTKTLHGDLSGFDIKINAFGELESTIDMDSLNAFLNREVRNNKIAPEKADDIPTE